MTSNYDAKWKRWWDDHLVAMRNPDRATLNFLKRYPFICQARPAQRPPQGDWRTWLFVGGRGAGKTRVPALIEPISRLSVTALCPCHKQFVIQRRRCGLRAA